MNLIQILDKLQAYSMSQNFIESVTKGDVYTNWNGHPDLKYGAVNMDVTNVQRNSNTVVYTIYLYYADRLLDDASNEYEVKTVAETILSSIINYAGEKIGDVEDSWQITYFNQQFADNLAGGYVNFNLEVESPLGDCLIEDYVTDYDRTIEELLDAIRELTEIIDPLRETIREQENYITQLEGTIAGLEARVESLTLTITNLQEYNAQLQQQIADLLDDIHDLNGQIASLNVIIDSQQGEITSLQAIVERDEAEIQRLQGVVNDLTNENQRLQGIVDAYESESHTLNIRLRDILLKLKGDDE